MEQKIIELINKYGYFSLFSLMTAENLFPPIPSEVILTAGGFLTTCTSMSFLGVVLFSTLGSVLGAILLFFLGRFLSQDTILSFLQSPLGHFLHFKTEEVFRALEIFQKKGSKAVLLCHFVPILRVFISISAGIYKVDPLTFLLYTIAGSFGWNFILVYMGSILGSHKEYFGNVYDTYSFIIKFVLFALVAFKLYQKVKTKKGKR